MAERIRALEDASTEHLHRKNARLSERIRILEDALTALHASKDGADGAVHPLLVEGEDFSLGADDAPTASRRMSESWEVLEGPGGKAAVASPSGDVIDAFGTLSISDHGISRFFGPTGGCEVCNFFLLLSLSFLSLRYLLLSSAFVLDRGSAYISWASR
jgi:hypothetical protein